MSAFLYVGYWPHLNPTCKRWTKIWWHLLSDFYNEAKSIYWIKLLPVHLIPGQQQMTWGHLSGKFLCITMAVWRTQQEAKFIYICNLTSMESCCFTACGNLGWSECHKHLILLNDQTKLLFSCLFNCAMNFVCFKL